MDSGSVHLSYGYDASDTLGQALLKLWKITSDPNLQLYGPENTAGNTCKRLNYRSWRLLNSKVPISSNTQIMSTMTSLNDVISSVIQGDDSSITLHHESHPLANQFLLKKDSLFLNNSKTTLFLHSSTSKSLSEINDKSLAVIADTSANDISDISDISEEDEDEDEDEFYDSEDDEYDHQQEVKQKNKSSSKLATNNTIISPVSNPSDFENSDSKTPVPSSLSAVSDAPPLRHSKTSFVRGFNPEALSVAYLSHPNLNPTPTLAPTLAPNVAPLASSHQQKANLGVFYIANSPSPPETDKNQTKSGSNSLKVCSGSSAISPGANLKPRSARNSNVGSHRGSHSSGNDDSSAWLSVSEDDEQPHDDKEEEIIFDKRSVHAIPKPINFNGSLASKSESFGEKNGDLHSLRPRSLLSGLFLNRMADISSTTNSSSKPGLKRSSTADAIRYNKQGSLLFDRNRNNSLNLSNRRSLSSRSQLSYVSATEESKEQATVGISDFNVNVYQHSKSEVNIIQEEDGTIRPNSPAEYGNTKRVPSLSSLHRLSTSLNKYSESVSRASSGLSINNLFLKSSKNLSGLFNSRANTTEPAAGGDTVISSRKSFVNGLFTKRKPDEYLGVKRDKNGQNSTGSDKDKDDVYIERNSSGNFTSESDTKDHKNGKENIFNTNNQNIQHNNNHNSNNDNNDIRDPDSNSNSNNDEDRKNNKTNGYGNSIGTVKDNIKENDTKNNVSFNHDNGQDEVIRFSSELSKSLKESILIDYKLGKIPLPDKVLDTLPIDKSSLDKLSSDDYHSKGW